MNPEAQAPSSPDCEQARRGGCSCGAGRLGTLRHPAVLTAGVLLWVLLLAAGTAYSTAREGLHADIILNSVMSLQKLTLFYWGQNRLFNVLPALVWGLRDPDLNLAAVLLATALSFYASLVSIAWLIARIHRLTAFSTALLCIALTATAPLVLKASALGELAIGHIEYSLPVLLACVSADRLWGQRRASAPALALTVVLALVAVGLNPAASLLMIAGAAGMALWRRRLDRREVVFAGAAALALAFWSWIASLHPGDTYGFGDPADTGTSVEQATRHLAEAVQPLALSVLLAVAAAAVLVSHLLRVEAADRSRTSFVMAALFVFSVGWIVAISLNDWVAANGYAWRYFTYVLYAATAAWGSWLAGRRWRRTGWLAGTGLVVLAVSAVHAVGLSQLRWPHHADFQVFRAVEAPPAPAPRFYAGHYWRVWPAVFLRLADGAPAFGLTERSHAMQSEMQSFVRRHAADGLLDIECLDATPEQCLGQVSRLLGQARLLEARELGEHAWRLRVEVRLGALRYAGTSFLELPAGTGRIDGQARRSVGEQGYLFFGAYTFMKAGRYRLSVRGATATVTNSRA